MRPPASLHVYLSANQLTDQDLTSKYASFILSPYKHICPIFSTQRQYLIFYRMLSVWSISLKDRHSCCDPVPAHTGGSNDTSKEVKFCCGHNSSVSIIAGWLWRRTGDVYHGAVMHPGCSERGRGGRWEVWIGLQGELAQRSPPHGRDYGGRKEGELENDQRALFCPLRRSLGEAEAVWYHGT